MTHLHVRTVRRARREHGFTAFLIRRMNFRGGAAIGTESVRDIETKMEAEQSHK